MTVMPEMTAPHQARRMLIVLACVVLMTAGCSFLNTTNSSNTNNGSCNAAGGNNSVSCPSVPTARASAAASAPSAGGTPSASVRTSGHGPWTETTYSSAKTFADFVNAGDPLGAPLQAQQAVIISCRVKGFAVADGDRWWYRLAQSPWNNQYYASTDNFYNTPTATGNPINGINFDKRVVLC